MRTDSWLEEKMWWLLENYFADVPVKNNITIKFGRRAKQRLGSIKRMERARPHAHFLHQLVGGEYLNKNSDSIVTITGHFRNEEVPDFVVISTIAHELVHYAHGFSSPLEQRFRHPHQGGIVKKEMNVRGLGDIYKKSEKWLKESWRVYLRRNT